MNVNDGNLYDIGLAQEKSKAIRAAFSDNFVEVDEEDMTAKQRDTKKVSLKDHRSKLGKQLTYERKERKLNRNDPCSCGSGLKYKKCCLVQ
jgi:uncharacterized protein YecA (UPF0149 family)